MSSGVRQKVRLFLEGREVPFESASITARAGQPTQASITMVPLSTIKNISPRTQVHLFLRDSLYFGDQNYRLAFEGEVVGRGYTKQQNNRAVSIRAIDYSSYWDDAKVHMMSANYLVGLTAGVVSNGDPTLDQVEKSEPGVTLKTTATANTRLLEILLSEKEFSDGLVKIITQLSGVNAYYKAAFDRLRITDRMKAYSSGRIAEFAAILKSQEFMQTFMGAYGGLTSLRALVDDLAGILFHQFVSIPFPAKLPKDIADPDGPKVITNFLYIPDTYSLPPPKCNVIFPNQQTGFSFEEDFRAVPTRYMYRSSFPLITSGGTVTPTYPALFFPTSFSDYMFKGKKSTAVEKSSQLGPSNLLKDKSGKTYAQIFYGSESKDNQVGVAFSPTLRESDFITNEESIRGIYYDTDVSPPAYSALVRSLSQVERNKFNSEVGKYLFFKKRYGSRPVSAEIMFNPMLVPGFNCLFLDDSDAGQSLIAKLDSISHTLTNQGCATTLNLMYGRDFDEVDAVTGGPSDPPTPGWFDTAIFGAVDKPKFAEETAYLKQIGLLTADEAKARAALSEATTYPKLSSFYQTVLGVDAITEYVTQNVSKKKKRTKPALVTTRGAVTYLASEYKKRSNDPVARDLFVRKYTTRPMASIIDAMYFLGAGPAASLGGKSVKQIPEEFAVFKSTSANVTIDTKMSPHPQTSRFDGVGYEDELILNVRRKTINEYVKLLKTKRGFRG